jgi:hypothetical protein
MTVKVGRYINTTQTILDDVIVPRCAPGTTLLYHLPGAYPIRVSLSGNYNNARASSPQGTLFEVLNAPVSPP